MAIACICGQSGSAKGLIPVIQSGVDLHGWQFSILTFGEATAVFKSEFIDNEVLSDIDLSVSDAVDWLNKRTPRVILLGSDDSRHVEKVFIRAAARLRIPTIMYIDYWSNYEGRFTDLEGRIEPEKVAVVDEAMASDIMAIGVSSSRIRVVGSPALECVSKAVEGVGKIERKILREVYSIADDSVCILFLSSPESELDFGDKPFIEKRQHSLLDLLDDLTKLLSGLGRLLNKKIYFIVRPHPREAASSFQKLDARGMQFTVSSKPSSFEALCIADLVIGLDTIMLIEALLAKKAVLSIGYVRPLNKAIESLMFLHGSLVSKGSELRAILMRYLTDERYTYDAQNVSLAEDATHRMVQLIMQLSVNDSA